MKPSLTTTIPLEAQYVYRRGLQMMEQQRDENALACLRQAVFIAPGFSKAYQELGNCLNRLGRPEEAAACYRKATLIELTGGGPAVTDCTRTLHADDRTVSDHQPACPVL